MHDFLWFIVFALILVTPFLPVLLKTKCPSCATKKLDPLETVKLPSVEESSGITFVTTYQCKSCSKYFKQVKSGKLESSSEDEYAELVTAAMPAHR